MRTNSRPYIGKGIVSGISGGIIGGIVMLGIMAGMIGMMNLPSYLVYAGPLSFAKLIGLTVGQQPQTAGTGLGIHLLASIIIGAIFGAVTSIIKKLAVTGYARGIGFGIAAGAIAFVVLFLPVMMGATSTQMMNPAMSSRMIIAQLQRMGPMILAGAFLAHIIYGAILGAITTVLITKIELRRLGDEGYRQRNQLR